MKKTKFLIKIMVVVLIVHFMLLPNSKAQSPYIGTTAYDLNWSLQTSLSDEFNSGPLDAGKWCVLQNCNYGGYPSCACYNWGGNSNYTSTNVSFSNGALNFKIDAPVGSPPYDFLHCCNTGGIQSNNESFSYGYLEINAVLPGFVDGNGDAHGDKFTPNFWTYHQEFDENDCEIVRDEIDILEPNGVQYMYADSNIVGVWNETTDTTKLHYAPPNSGCTVGTYKVPGSVASSSPLCSAYHKFAAEWNTDRMVYYFDDVPFFVSHDAGNVMDNMRLIIAQSINKDVYDFYPGTFSVPQYMKVDYFHYYKLRLDCSNSLTILNNTDLANYWVSGVPAVKSNITFGNGANTISLSSGTHYIFRAVNTLTINGEFTAPSGTELTLMPTPCY